MPRVGLIVNDGKALAVKTAKTFQKKLEDSGFDVVRVSSSGGLLGFANPDQYMSSQRYNSCIPDDFDSSINGCERMRETEKNVSVYFKNYNN